MSEKKHEPGFILGRCEGWSNPHQQTDICRGWQSEPVASPQATRPDAEMQTRILDAAYAQQKRMEVASPQATCQPTGDGSFIKICEKLREEYDAAQPAAATTPDVTNGYTFTVNFREAAEIIIRNIRGGAVTTTWVAHYLQVVAESYRKNVPDLQTEAAGLREEIERLKATSREMNRRNQQLQHTLHVESGGKEWHGYFTAALQLFGEREEELAELRVKLAEQERETKSWMASLRKVYEDWDWVQRDKCMLPKSLCTNLRNAVAATDSTISSDKQLLEQPYKLLRRAEAAEAERAALRERERHGRTVIPTGDALEAYNAGYAAGKQHGK